MGRCAIAMMEAGHQPHILVDLNCYRAETSGAGDGQSDVRGVDTY